MTIKRTLWFFLYCFTTFIAVYVNLDMFEDTRLNKFDVIEVSNNPEAQAKFDLQHNNAKIYVYGFAIKNESEDIYNTYKVQLVYRGCIIGGEEYKREMRYNLVVKSTLGLSIAGIT